MKIKYLVLAFFLSGCVSMGQQIDSGKVDQIKEGVTTEAQVIELLGTPFSREVTDNSKVKLSYVYTRVKPKARNFIPFVSLFMSVQDQEKHTLSILIDDNGVVEKQTLNKVNDQLKMGLLA